MRRHLMMNKRKKLIPFNLPIGQIEPNAGVTRVSRSEYKFVKRIHTHEATASVFWEREQMWGDNLLVISIEGMTEKDVVGFGSGSYSAIQKKFTKDGLYEVEPKDFTIAAYGLKIWNLNGETWELPAITVKFYRYE